MSPRLSTERAKHFAELAHGLVLNEAGELGQRRKSSGVPYTEHLSEVADALKHMDDGDEGLRSAALAALQVALEGQEAG